jgi:Cys-rich repeat protein
VSKDGFGTCVVPAPPPQACTTDADCPSGDQCVGDGSGAYCEPAAPACKTDADCPNGQSCVDINNTQVCQ